MKYIKRKIKIPKNKSFFLFGPRQTGKSTLIKQSFTKKIKYYDLLKSDIYRYFKTNPEYLRNEILYELKHNNIQYIIIDEIQKIPQLLDEIHYLIENKIKCNFILSGSSSRKLKREKSNMLAGRLWDLQLYPFIYEEIKDNFDLSLILKYGSLPPVFLSSEIEEKEEILRAYVNVYLKEEIEIEANIRNLGSFLRFLNIVAEQNTELVNFTNIARECSVSNYTVKNYYKILEDTLLGFFLLPYSKSIRKKLSKHPKFYFFEIGIVTALTNQLRNNISEFSYEFGKKFEHFIILEIYRLNSYLRKDLKLSYYRTERGNEVDLIIESPLGKTIAIEIKSTKSPTKKMCNGLLSFKEKVPNSELILCCRINDPQLIDIISILPWQKTLEFIINNT